MKITFRLNHRWTLVLAVMALLSFSACQNKDTIKVRTDEPPAFNDKNDSLSWVLGFSAAQNISGLGVDINREILIKAICTTLDSKEQPFTKEQTITMLMELEKEAYMKQAQDESTKLKETQEREATYFANLIKDNPNVKKHEKGFYYEVLKEGSGKQGGPGLVAVFDYKGFFTNGQIIDQTYGNRPPITHVINESIFPGLYEGLCMMKAGSTYRFYFPSELAFGARGSDNIPPFTTIIYEVEVHDVYE